MSLRMHRYGDGLTGLAAFCDTCGEQIIEDGYVVWNGDDPADWLVIHQARCEPADKYRYDCSMPFDVEIVYLANSIHANLEEARKSVATFAMLG